MATEQQEFILVWETMPPAEYETIHCRSSNFVSLLDGNREGDWYINLKLQAEDGSVFDKVIVEIVGHGGHANVESIYFLNSYNKDVLHVKHNASIKIRSNLLVKGKFVVKLQVKCVSSAMKPSIWLNSKTVVNQTAFKSIKSDNGSKKFTVMLNNKEYPFSTRKPPGSYLYIDLETIPRLWSIIAVAQIPNYAPQIHYITKAGEHNYSTNTNYILLDAYTSHYTSFEEMDNASISKISKSINKDVVEEPTVRGLENLQPLCIEHLSAKEEVFKELYTKQELCDVTVQSKDLNIRAHKIVLASCSSVWRKYFISDETLDVVQIPEFEHATISILMEYIYNGTVPQSSNTKLEQLLIFANKYGITGLKEHCATLLAKSIYMDNVVELATLAHENNVSTLRNSVFAFIRDNFEEFKKLSELESIFFAHPELALQILKL